MSLSALVAEKMNSVQADFERRHPGVAEADLALGLRAGRADLVAPAADVTPAMIGELYR